MAEYIEREALISELKTLSEQERLGYMGIYDCIMSMPADDVVKNTHGIWIADDYMYYHCSECGYEHDNPEYTTPFCPGCGAKMDKEEQNHDSK